MVSSGNYYEQNDTRCYISTRVFSEGVDREQLGGPRMSMRSHTMARRDARRRRATRRATFAPELIVVSITDNGVFCTRDEVEMRVEFPRRRAKSTLFPDTANILFYRETLRLYENVRIREDENLPRIRNYLKYEITINVDG